MLVLTRSVGQEIVIGGVVRITILSTGRDKIRLGIDAPPNVRVDRLEIHNKRIESADESLGTKEHLANV